MAVRLPLCDIERDGKRGADFRESNFGGLDESLASRRIVTRQRKSLHIRSKCHRDQPSGLGEKSIASIGHAHDAFSHRHRSSIVWQIINTMQRSLRFAAVKANRLDQSLEARHLRIAENLACRVAADL